MRRRKSKERIKQNDGTQTRWWILTVGWNLLFLLPILVLILSALSARWTFPHLLPEVMGGRGFAYLAANAGNISGTLLSSVGYSLTVVAVSALLTILPAGVLARYEFPGRRILEALFLSPVLIPAITYAMGLHFTLVRIGLSDTFAGVVLVLTAASYPYMLRALIAGFQGINPELEVCAENLGAGYLRRLFRIVLPLLTPALVSGGSVVFLVAFSDYFLVFLIGGGAVPSFTGYLFPFLSAADQPIASALTLVFLAAPLVLFFLTDRIVFQLYRRRGLL